MSETSREFPIRAAPYQHQRKAAAFALERLESGGGAALLMEMGTGKTLTTIAIVGALWQEARIQRLLVVAPLSILGVWEDEFERFAAFDYSGATGMNSAMSGEFPILKPGMNAISWSGDVTKVEVNPNWRYLV